MHDLMERATRDPFDRITRLTLPAGATFPASAQGRAERPLLAAGLAWVRALMCRAGFDPLGNVAKDSTLPPSAVGAQRAETPAPRMELPDAADVEAADAALAGALASADVVTEPLAALARGLELTPLEFKFVVLALAPELDTLYQHFMAKLLLFCQGLEPMA